MDARWRIELLGRFRATCGERVVTRFRSQKTAALLAYLAYCRDRAHPRSVLAELFWPGTSSNPTPETLSRGFREASPVRSFRRLSR